MEIYSKEVERKSKTWVDKFIGFDRWCEDNKKRFLLKHNVPMYEKIYGKHN